jgi:methylated-DNA-[protein]-cysteine S-methyltransferase
MSTRHAVVETVLGELTLVATDDAVTGLYFPHHWHRPPREAFGSRVDAAGDNLITEAGRQLAQYLAGDRIGFELPIQLRGNDFQERVWQRVAQIPYGETATYGELAESLGGEVDAKTLGQTIGQNPLCVFVPCHRVVGKDGRLAGYAGGRKRKQFLLDLEQQVNADATRD